MVGGPQPDSEPFRVKARNLASAFSDQLAGERDLRRRHCEANQVPRQCFQHHHSKRHRHDVTHSLAGHRPCVDQAPCSPIVSPGARLLDGRREMPIELGMEFFCPSRSGPSGNQGTWSGLDTVVAMKPMARWYFLNNTQLWAQGRALVPVKYETCVSHWCATLWSFGQCL